jgi:hypothetical protein
VTGFEAWSGLPLMFAQGPAKGIAMLRSSPHCDRLTIGGRDGSLQVGKLAAFGDPLFRGFCPTGERRRSKGRRVELLKAPRGITM